MTEHFYGPKLKIKRAKQHIGDLHSKLQAFAATDYYSLRVDKDAETGNNILKFSVTKAPPEETALVIGDAIHNLKSALDLLVNDVFFEKLNRRSDYTKFPVCETRDKLVATMNGGTIRQASEAIADLIVDVIKPYKGGNDALYALHHLDICDKHMLLLPVVQITSLLDVSAEDDRGARMVNATLVIDGSGKSANVFATPGELQIKNYGKPVPSIFFDKGLPMEGEPIFPTLLQFTERVCGVLESFQTVCFGKKA
jgi:hypothetical protein